MSLACLNDGNVILSIHHFGPTEISLSSQTVITMGWVAVKYSTDIHGPQWMNPNDLGPRIFPLALTCR